MEDWKDVLKEHLFSEKSESEIGKIVEDNRKNIPKSLYRYRSFNENNLRCLREDNTWCASAQTFNDPYDSTVKLSMSEQDKKDLYIKGFLISLKMLNIPFLEQDIIERIKQSPNPEIEYAKILKKQTSTVDINMLENMRDDFNKKLDEQYISEGVRATKILKTMYKISCFCENLHSMPMWYHYADRYRGFVAEYNFSEVNEILEHLWPVLYTKKLFDLSAYLKAVLDGKSPNKMMAIFACITKSIDWSYEKEWRLIHYDGSMQKGQLYPAPKIKALYIGKDAGDSDRKTLIEIAGSKTVPVYDMELAQSEFRMIPHLVENDTKI